MKFSYLKTLSALSMLILFMALIVPPVSVDYDWVMEGNNLNCEFGFWMDGQGDVNGDGYDDLIIGAPDYDQYFVGEGAVFIYYGSASGLSDVPGWVRFGEHDSSGFGRCVSIHGDVDHDGYDDVLIGSHQFTGTKVNEGKVYFYPGGPGGPDTIPSWTMVSARKGAKLGEAVAIVGDVNDDGFDDICVGAHGWDDNEVLGDSIGNKAGKAWVFLGTPDGPDDIANLTEVGGQTDNNIGVSVDRAGDINNDGYMDLAIGGYIFLIGDGMICVFNGSEEGIDEDMEFTAIGGAEDTSFYAVNLSTAGDLNGDGYDDVVIGAPRFDANGIYQSGKLHVHYGSPTGLTEDIGWIGTGTQYDERWAFNVNEGGDINKDGYGDLLVGAKYFDNGDLSNAGKAELFLGGPKGPQRIPTWTFKGLDSTDVVGTNICNAGDLNGDGYDDIAVSGDEYTGDLAREGIVYVFYGQPQQCDPPEHLSIYFMTPNSVTVGWKWLYGSQKYKFYMKRVDAVGTQWMVPTQDSVLIIGGLVPGAHYVGYVQAKCEGGWTARSNILNFYTPLHKEGELTGINVFPTLATDQISISMENISGEVSVNIMDMKGARLINKKYLVDNAHSVIMINEISDLSRGRYFIVVESTGNLITKQFIKQ
ncbi:MAG: T9SS type A sorting domain-containing protein [Chitinophagales bacterium]